MLRRVVVIRSRVRGAEHPSVARAMLDLSSRVDDDEEIEDDDEDTARKARAEARCHGFDAFRQIDGDPVLLLQPEPAKSLRNALDQLRQDRIRDLFGTRAQRDGVGRAEGCLEWQVAEEVAHRCFSVRSICCMLATRKRAPWSVGRAASGPGMSADIIASIHVRWAWGLLGACPICDGTLFRCTPRAPDYSLNSSGDTS